MMFDPEEKVLRLDFEIYENSFTASDSDGNSEDDGDLCQLAFIQNAQLSCATAARMVKVP